MEDNLDELCEIIFKTPLPKKSIDLEINPDSNMFEIFLDLAQRGMFKLFNRTDPLDLTDYEFKYLNLCLGAIGIKVCFIAKNSTMEANSPEKMKKYIKEGHVFPNYKIFVEFI